MQYRTKYSSDYLFRNARIQNDIKTSDDVRIFTPLNRQELRNPREEDKELARNLLDHLNENIERVPPCHLALDEPGTALYAAGWLRSPQQPTAAAWLRWWITP